MLSETGTLCEPRKDVSLHISFKFNVLVPLSLLSTPLQSATKMVPLSLMSATKPLSLSLVSATKLVLQISSRDIFRLEARACGDTKGLLMTFSMDEVVETFIGLVESCNKACEARMTLSSTFPLPLFPGSTCMEGSDGGNVGKYEIDDWWEKGI